MPKKTEQNVIRPADNMTLNVEIKGEVVAMTWLGSLAADNLKFMAAIKDDETATAMLQECAADDTTRGLVEVMPERLFVALQLQNRYTARLAEIGKAFTTPKA